MRVTLHHGLDNLTLIAAAAMLLIGVPYFHICARAFNGRPQ